MPARPSIGQRFDFARGFASESSRVASRATTAAARNTLIDVQQGRSFDRTNEVISTSRFAPSFRFLRRPRSHVVCLLDSLSRARALTHTHMYTVARLREREICRSQLSLLPGGSQTRFLLLRAALGEHRRRAVARATLKSRRPPPPRIIIPLI